MQIVDANVLLGAVNRDDPNHRPARQWLDGSLTAGEPVGFAWVVLLAFLRLSTRRGVFPAPLSLVQAADVLESWLGHPSAVVVHPTPLHLGVLRELLDPFGTAGNLTTDAHLAALAVEHRGEVISFDTDFGRFGGAVRWRSPASRGR